MPTPTKQAEKKKEVIKEDVVEVEPTPSALDGGMANAIRELQKNPEKFQSTETDEERQEEESPADDPAKDDVVAKETVVDDAPKKEQDSDDEKELDSIDFDKIVGRGGQPISQRSREIIEKLHKSRGKFAAKAEKLESELADVKKQISETKPTDTEELTKLRAERDDLDKKLNDLLFTESEEFRSTYVKPIEDTIKNINKYASSVDQAELPELRRRMMEADSLLGNQDHEIDYVRKIDEIAEKHFPGSIGNRFIIEATKLWDLHLKKQAAFEDKDKARSEVTSKLRENTDRGIKAFEDRISAELSAFELTPLGKFYTENDKATGYKDSVPKRKDLAKRVLGDFIQTGVVTAELADIVLFGVMKDTAVNERKFMGKGFTDAMEQLKVVEKERDELKAKLKNLSAKGTSGGYTQRQDDDDDKPKKGRSSMAEAAASAMAR